MTLLDWAERYVKHRDLFERKIARIEKQGSQLLVRLKDGSGYKVLASEVLNESLLPLIDQLAQQEPCLIVAQNKKENLSFLTKHWRLLASKQRLKLVFVNLEKDERWVLIPHSHDKVAEQGSLRAGLLSLYQSVG